MKLTATKSVPPGFLSVFIFVLWGFKLWGEKWLLPGELAPEDVLEQSGYRAVVANIKHDESASFIKVWRATPGLRDVIYRAAVRRYFPGVSSDPGFILIFPG